MISKSYKILNSNGEWTVETKLKTKYGIIKSSLPLGTSTSKFEVNYKIERIIKELNEKRIPEINSIDDIFEFEKKFKNPPLTLSFCLLKYIAKKEGKEVWELLSKRKKMPFLWNKIVGGGEHAGGPSIQEFLISVRSKKFEKRIEIAEKVHREFGKRLKVKGVDLEGGWTTNMDSIDVLKMLREIVNKAEKEYKTKILIGIDAATSTLYINKKYVYSNFILNREQNIKFMNDIIKKFKIYYVEDPVEQNDINGCKRIKSKLVVGDDLIASNPERIKKVRGINGVIAKPNQIGYLYKFFDFIKEANKKKYRIIVSHRSNETNDNIISDLSVAFGDLKIGLVRGERVSKLNRLLEIEKSFKMNH